MKHLLTPMALAAQVVLAGAGGIAAAAEPAWDTGVQFERKLSSPVSVLWSENALRDALIQFGRAQQVAVYVDRRIDPDRKLDLDVRDVPVVEVFREVARYQKLGVAVLGDVVFVCPPESARRAWTVSALRLQEAEKTGPAAAAALSSKERFTWDDLATPREILAELAGGAGLQIVNLDRIPHDLWPAADLPTMSLVDRLTLVLEQFDMTFRLAPDGRRIALVPVEDDVGIVLDYPGGARAEELVEAWRSLAPSCRFEIVGGRIYARGLMEDHEKIAASLRGTQAASHGRPRPAGPSEKVFTAKNANVPLGAVLKSFAEQLGLELQVDLESLRRAGVSLEQLISFEVEQASLDELFDAVLQPVGCTHEKRGNVLVVRAAP